MIHPKEVYPIGKFTRTHGVRGEMALSFTDDVFDRTECPYLGLFYGWYSGAFFYRRVSFQE